MLSGLVRLDDMGDAPPLLLNLLPLAGVSLAELDELVPLRRQRLDAGVDQPRDLVQVLADCVGLGVFGGSFSLSVFNVDKMLRSWSKLLCSL